MESVSSIGLPLGVEWEEVMGVGQQLQCCCLKTGQAFQQTSARTITGEHSYAFLLPFKRQMGFVFLLNTTHFSKCPSVRFSTLRVKCLKCLRSQFPKI